MKFRFSLVIVALLVTQPAIALATDFSKGTWDLTLTDSFIRHIGNNRENMNTPSLGVGYYFWDNYSVSFDIATFHVDQIRASDAEGGEIDLLFRTHVYNVDRFSLFFDGGGGMIWTDEPVPDNGTTYNFTLRLGVGGTIRLAKNWYFIGGARYFHLSNSSVHGHDQNPGFNGVEGYGGLMFTF